MGGASFLIQWSSRLGACRYLTPILSRPSSGHCLYNAKSTGVLLLCRHRPSGLISRSCCFSSGKMNCGVEVAEQQKVNKGIADFYDESSGMWEDLWGDHIHHGFYDPHPHASDHRAAQIRMIEEVLRFASVSEDPEKKPKKIVDVGCGIGGSCTYLARKYCASCEGITLSPKQVKRAQALAAAQGLGEKVCFQVADALNQPFPDGEFDLVWCMETAEHIPDKAKLVSELARVAAPGGRIVIVTWCHRDTQHSNLHPQEKQLLNNIRNAVCLSPWSSASHYVNLLQSNSLQDIKVADWSENAAPSWPALRKSALSWKGITSLLTSGWKTLSGTLALHRMVIEGYKKGVIKYAIITCRKSHQL